VTIAKRTTVRNKENLCKPYAQSEYLPEECEESKMQEKTPV
jgi:hypothetical protein